MPMRNPNAIYQKKRPARKRAGKAKPAARRRRVRRSAGSAMSQLRVMGLPGIATETLFKVVKPKPRMGLSTLAAPLCTLYNRQSQLFMTAGIQNASIIGTWGSVADFHSISESWPAETISSPFPPNRFLFKSLLAECQMSNTGSSALQIDLYTVQCIRAPIAPDLDAAQSVYNPLIAWSNGLQNQYVGSATPPSYAYNLIPGSNPNDSQLFKDFYRIVQRKEMWLQPGAVHTHNVNLTWNKVLDKNLLNTYDLTVPQLPGMTYTSFVIVRGQPGSVVESDTSATTLANGGLRWVSTERYVTQAVFDNGMKFSYAGLLDQATAGVKTQQFGTTTAAAVTVI